MSRFTAFLLPALLAPGALLAQTCDLVFFTDDGARFTLVIDGDVKNAEPAARVVATGIRNETPLCVVRFEDASIPEVRQNAWFTMGKETTVAITTNKKGQRVLRPQGEAELGTAAKAEPAKPKPAAPVADDPAPAAVISASPEGVQHTTTTTTVVQEGGAPGENVNMSIGINGVGLNVNVGVNDGTARQTTHTTTTHTTTTTTTTTAPPAQHSRPAVRPVPTPEAAPYRMPGYTGPIGCAMPMSEAEFADARKSIEGKGFEETKLTMAKQIGRDRCFSTDQVKGIMGLFSFEETRLDFAKWAYERTHDRGNYYKVNDAFSFSSSIDELNGYIESH